VTPGAVAAVVLWLVASGGLALYASSFGSYEKSWGTLSAVVVTLLWLWVTSAALLFAAEINAETRRLLDADPDTGSDDAAAPTGGLSSVAEDRVPASGPSRSRG
jgi:membrane protein